MCVTQGNTVSFNKPCEVNKLDKIFRKMKCRPLLPLEYNTVSTILRLVKVVAELRIPAAL